MALSATIRWASDTGSHSGKTPVFWDRMVILQPRRAFQRMANVRRGRTFLSNKKFAIRERRLWRASRRWKFGGIFGSVLGRSKGGGVNERERQDLAERIAAEERRLADEREAPKARTKAIAGWVTAVVIVLFSWWVWTIQHP
jgi:hypothetical protein